MLFNSDTRRQDLVLSGGAMVLAVGLAVAGCGGSGDSSGSSAPETTAVAATTPEATSGGDSAAEPTSAPTTAEAQQGFPDDAVTGERSEEIANIGDLGDDRVWVDDQNVLHAGGHSMRILIDDTERAFDKEFSDLSVAEVGGRPLIVVRHPTSGVEDPPNRHQLFRVDEDALEQVYEVVLPQATVLEVNADSVGYETADVATCPNDGSGTTDVIRVDVDITGDGPWTEGRAPTGGQIECILLMAG